MSTFTTTALTQSIDPNNRSEHIGIQISRSGVVIINDFFYTDANFPTKEKPDLSKFLVCDVGGTIVFQYFDRTYGFINAAVAGFFYPISAIRVVDSYTFNNGGLKATTASGISWYGGI